MVEIIVDTINRNCTNLKCKESFPRITVHVRYSGVNCYQSRCPDVRHG